MAVSSTNSHVPGKCLSIYGASKGALEAAVKTLAYELTGKFRINAVVPGPVNTPMQIEANAMYRTESNIEKFKQEALGLAEPEDIANVILFLLSDASKFVTGRNYYVDGGRLA